MLQSRTYEFMMQIMASFRLKPTVKEVLLPWTFQTLLNKKIQNISYGTVLCHRKLE